MSALERPARQVVLRPQVGLMLSIGEPPTDTRNYPKKLDHFRPKPGSEGQFAPAVARFHDKYPDEPKVLDILFLSNDLGDLYEIKWMAWGTSGLRAVGATNYALCPERMGDADDRLTTFPEDKPEPGSYQLQGPDDPTIEKTGLKLYGTLRFALEGVTGLTTLAQITTTSKRSMLNLHAGIVQVLTLTGGQIAGIPLELAVRPARTRYFDEQAKRRKTSTFYELVLQAPGAIDEFFEKARLRREQMQGGKPLVLEAGDDAERFFRETRIAGDIAALPAAPEEPVAIRDEPEAAESPPDALLNRIAALEAEDREAAGLTLTGVFGVQSATELSEEDAEKYERFLRAHLDSRAEDGGEPEVVDDEGQGSFSIPETAQRHEDRG